MFLLQLGIHEWPPQGSPGPGNHLVGVRVQHLDEVNESTTKLLWDEKSWS